MFRLIQLPFFNMGNIVYHYWTLKKVLSYFLFLLFKDFATVFSPFVNCKQAGIFFRLLAYPLQLSSAIEYLKVTLCEAVYYLSYSV